jgi:hypothetical protein
MRDYEKEYSNVMNALADSVFEMSDEEVEEYIQKDGDNTEQIRQVLLNAVPYCSYVCGQHLEPCVLIRRHVQDCRCKNC